jgi:hypothetical protein
MKLCYKYKFKEVHANACFIILAKHLGKCDTQVENPPPPRHISVRNNSHAVDRVGMSWTYDRKPLPLAGIEPRSPARN